MWKLGHLSSSNTILPKKSFAKNIQNDNAWVYLNQTQLQASSTLENIQDSEAILPPFMALIVSLSYSAHTKRARKALLLGLLIGIEQLQCLGAFSDLFFMWTLSDSLTFRASLAEPHRPHLNCTHNVVPCCLACFFQALMRNSSSHHSHFSTQFNFSAAIQFFMPLPEELWPFWPFLITTYFPGH